MAKERLGDILIRAGLLDRDGLDKALQQQRRWGGLLGHYLVELGLVSEENLVRALSTQYKLPAVSISPEKLDVKTAQLVPQRICERHRLICFRADVKNRFIDVALANPANADAIDDVRVATRFNVRAHIAGPRVIDRAITYVFYGELPTTLGGEIDLSPDSPLRAGPKVEPARRAPSLESVTTRRRDAATREVGFLSGEVSIGEDDSQPVAPAALPVMPGAGVPPPVPPAPPQPPAPPRAIEPVQSAELPITIEGETGQHPPAKPATPPVDLEPLLARIARLELQHDRSQKALARVVKMMVRKGWVSPREASEMAID